MESDLIMDSSISPSPLLGVNVRITIMTPIISAKYPKRGPFSVFFSNFLSENNEILGKS